MSNTPDMNKEREAFEAWYCDQMRAAGYNADEGIAQLREGNHYGKERVMLNGKWEGWQARASLAASAGSEPVAWGIFDSQGFYEAAHDQESAERFCAHYNKRKGADPIKPYTARPLYTHPSPPEGAGWRPIAEAPQNGRTLLLGYFNSAGKWRTTRGQWMSQDYIDEYAEDPDCMSPGWYETTVEDDDGKCWPIDPTHFMPMPPAPPAYEAKGA